MNRPPVKSQRLRPISLLPLGLAALAALSVVACEKRTAAPAVQTEAPPLPADVAGLSPATSAPPASAASAASGAPATAGLIESTGELVSPVRSELVAKNPGRVAKILAEEGVRVTRGQPLLEMESDYWKLEADRASAELARAEAAFQDAKRDFDRKKELAPKSAVSEAAYQRSEALFTQAGAARAAAAAGEALARQRLADAVLRSPIDGVVAERRTDPGERLGDASVAFVVVSTSPLRIRFRVPERHLAAIRVGQAVTATVDPFPGETFAGRVTMTGQTIDSASRTFSVESEIPNRDGRLRPGLFARVRLETGEAPRK